MLNLAIKGGWKIITAIATAAGIGGVAYGVDQHNKRRESQGRFNSELQALKERLAAKESELEQLRNRLGEKNEQVRILANEVAHLRAELAEKMRAA